MSRLVVFLLNVAAGFWKKPPVLLVLALNLIPVFCVWKLGWNALTLLVLYWVENVAIGVANYIRLRAIERRNPQRVTRPFTLSSFFLMHYGLFTAVHGVFAFLVGGVIENPDPGATFARFWAERGSFGLAVLALFLVYGAELLAWMRSDAPRTTDPDRQMFAPYGRILVMHLTVLGGAAVMAATRAPAGYILLLAVLKTLIETWWAWFHANADVRGATMLKRTS